MFRQEDEGVHLKSFPSLIRSEALAAKEPILRIHLWCLIFLYFIFAVLYIGGFQIDFRPILDLLLALIILLIGLNLELKEKQFKFFVTIYILLYTIAALSIVYKFATGFIIYDIYIPVPKNQLAPAYAVALFLSLFSGIKQKGIIKWLYFICLSLLSATLLVLRGRAAIVAVIITTLIFIFYFFREKKHIFFSLILIALIILFAGDFIYKSMFSNYDVSDLNSVSSGRMERNIQGIKFLNNNLFLGQLGNPDVNFGKIHNYILITMVSYGLVFSTLIIYIYFSYIQIIINAVILNTSQYYEVGPLVMTILFIISLFEYTYPYAPGSAIFFAFFLMGQYLKNNTKSNSYLINNF